MKAVLFIYIPLWMCPGSSDSVVLTILIPAERLSRDLRDVSRKDISPQATQQAVPVDALRAANCTALAFPHPLRGFGAA